MSNFIGLIFWFLCTLPQDKVYPLGRDTETHPMMRRKGVRYIFEKKE